MKTSARRKFIAELREPMKSYCQKMREKHLRYVRSPHSFTPEDEQRLMSELECKYEELFGPSDSESEDSDGAETMRPAPRNRKSSPL